jgi:acyl carrier protein
MTEKQKLNCLEELLDIEKDTLNEETELDQLSQWDSMAVISLIAMFDAEFGKTITAEEIRELKKVKDILEMME